jgi:hypothetical protein
MTMPVISLPPLPKNMVVLSAQSQRSPARFWKFPQTNPQAFYATFFLLLDTGL